MSPCPVRGRLDRRCAGARKGRRAVARSARPPSVVHRHSMGAPTPAAPHSHSGLRFRNRLGAAAVARKCACAGRRDRRVVTSDEHPPHRPGDGGPTADPDCQTAIAGRIVLADSTRLIVTTRWDRSGNGQPAAIPPSVQRSSACGGLPVRPSVRGPARVGRRTRRGALRRSGDDAGLVVVRGELAVTCLARGIISDAVRELRNRARRRRPRNDGRPGCISQRPRWIRAARPLGAPPGRRRTRPHPDAKAAALHSPCWRVPGPRALGALYVRW